MSQEIKNKIKKLIELIRRHDYLYYVLSQPEISDKEYDNLMKQLRELEEKYPEYKTDDSVTMRLSGGALEGFKTVKHKERMFSLDNSYSFKELKEWQARVYKGLAGEKVEYAVELKIDGLSANISYSRGKLSIGATRGDGQTGEDVTANIKTIRSIPLVLLGSDTPDFIEIRGEVFMEINDFKILNKGREELGEVLFANPRNAASGSLKLLDTAVVAKRKLNFFAHSLGEYKGEAIQTQLEFLRILKTWGIRTNPQSRLCENFDQVIEYCRYWQAQREKLGYEIDGVVVKVNNLLQQKRLGFTSKSPRWAIAYKFPARQATTEVLKININVGRTGVITPTAELSPVECSGVIIRNATLHNFDEIKRLNIKEGDRVLIERAGDVIPKIVKVVASLGKKSFHLPRVCPECLSKVIKEKEEDVAYRCINPVCPALLERGLEHFASRTAMDIEGMGEAVVRQLIKLKLVRNFADIYKLNEFDLAKLELFKKKKINNLIEAIKKSKEKPLSRLIFALGIRHVGENAAYILARHFITMDKLINAKREDFDLIYEIGPVIAGSLKDYFSQKPVRKMLEELKNMGLNLREEPSNARATPLSGKTVVFTGELVGFSRSQAEEMVRKSAGNVSSSVSRNVNFVVAGDNPGSKFDKAKELGIKIISEKEFTEMIK